MLAEWIEGGSWFSDLYHQVGRYARRFEMFQAPASISYADEPSEELVTSSVQATRQNLFRRHVGGRTMVKFSVFVIVWD